MHICCWCIQYVAHSDLCILCAEPEISEEKKTYLVNSLIIYNIQMYLQFLNIYIYVGTDGLQFCTCWSECFPTPEKGIYDYY